jgi:proprotein convertase subtilisin/kexin type 5
LKINMKIVSIKFLLIFVILLIKNTKSCDVACATCSTGDTNTDCDTCNTDNQYYSLSTNAKACYSTATLQSQNYYLDNTVTPTVWKECNTSCLTCSKGTETDCLTCDVTKGLYIYNTSCAYRTSAPAGFYFDTNESKFKNCYTGCDICAELGDANNNKCYKCTNASWSIPNTQNCVDPNTALVKYFYDQTDSKWKQCYKGCKTCDGVGDSSNNKCTGETCETSDYIWFKDANDNRFCILKTAAPPVGYFYDASINGSAFTACHANCATCKLTGTDSKQNCLSCKNINQKVLTNDANNNCYDVTGANPNPPTGYGWNGISSFIYDNSNCFSSCSTCNALGNEQNHNCIKCKLSYFPLSTDIKQCFNSKSGYYTDASINQWKQCNSSCLTCLDGVSCLTCAVNKYKNSLTNLCVDNCPDGFYKDTTDKTCKPCSFPCLNCESKESCLTCPTTYILGNGNAKKCTRACLDNQYSDNVGNCLSCPIQCATCSNGFTCLTCAQGYFAFADKCTKECPQGYYMKTDNNGIQQCYLCDDACLECTNNSKVCKCKPGLFISPSEGNICAKNCPVNQYPDSTGLCKTCTEMGKLINSDQCIDQCPMYHFPFNGICKTCKDAGQFNYGEGCIPECPSGYAVTELNHCYLSATHVDPSKIISELNTILECDPQPCLNVGICKTTYSNGQAVNYCECAANYYGRRCEYDSTESNKN